MPSGAPAGVLVGPSIGFDRTRLQLLRGAAIEALHAGDRLGSNDPGAWDATATLRGAVIFLRYELLPTVDAVLALDVFDRPVRACRLERLLTLTRVLQPWRTPDEATAGADPMVGPTGLEGRDLDALVANLLDQVHAEQAAHDLDHPFWSGAGRAHLEELRRRLIADASAIDSLLAIPAVLPVLARLLGSDDRLPPEAGHRVAVGVLTTPFSGSIAGTPLAADAVERATAHLSSDAGQAEQLLLDAEAVVTMLRRGHVPPEQLGAWIDSTVEQLDAEGWPDDRTVDLLRSLSRISADEPLGPTATPPPELAVPVAVLASAALPLLAAGRTPGGAHLYPPVGGVRAGDERIDRDEFRELLGVALRDEVGATVLFVGLRTTLRDAAMSDRPELSVDRVDEVARIVDEAVTHEGAELASLHAAQLEWASSMLGGLDRVAVSVGQRVGPVAGAATSAAVETVQQLGRRIVDTATLPFTTVRGYYEMTRSMEIRRRGVLDARTTTDAATQGSSLRRAVAALDRIDGRIDANLDGTAHDVNVAWLEFEDASEPFADPQRFGPMRW